MAFSWALALGRHGRAQRCPSQRPEPQRALWRRDGGGSAIRVTPRWVHQIVAAPRRVSIPCHLFSWYRLHPAQHPWIFQDVIRHCPLQHADLLSSHHRDESGPTADSFGPSAATRMPVISPHPWHLCCISWRYSGADSRCRRGRTCCAIGPDAARKRCACPGEVNPCLRRSRWRVGWCEFCGTENLQPV